MVLRSSPSSQLGGAVSDRHLPLVISIGPQCTIYCMHLVNVWSKFPPIKLMLLKQHSRAIPTTTVSCLPLHPACSPLPPHLHLQLPAPIFLFPLRPLHFLFPPCGAIFPNSCRVGFHHSCQYLGRNGLQTSNSLSAWPPSDRCKVTVLYLLAYLMIMFLSH